MKPYKKEDNIVPKTNRIHLPPPIFSSKKAEKLNPPNSNNIVIIWYTMAKAIAIPNTDLQKALFFTIFLNAIIAVFYCSGAGRGHVWFLGPVFCQKLPEDRSRFDWQDKVPQT